MAALVPDSLPGKEPLGRGTRSSGRLGAARPALPPVVTFFSPEQKPPPVHARVPGELAGHEGKAWLLNLLDELRRGGARGLDAILAADVRSYLPYDLLVKMDIATMANSLEARSPFLDHKVMEFAARLPSRHKIRGSTQKYLLKKLARKALPAECWTAARWVRRAGRVLDAGAPASAAGKTSCSPRPTPGGASRTRGGPRDGPGHTSRGRETTTYRLWSLFGWSSDEGVPHMTVPTRRA